MPHQRLDKRPGLGLDAWLVRGQLSRQCQFLRLLRAIATLPAVALEFARDSGLVAANDGGHPGLAVVSFLQGVNLVSLLAGKLRVAHQCASLTWRFEKARYATAACPLTTNLKVALTS